MQEVDEKNKEIEVLEQNNEREIKVPYITYDEVEYMMKTNEYQDIIRKELEPFRKNLDQIKNDVEKDIQIRHKIFVTWRSMLTIVLTLFGISIPVFIYFNSRINGFEERFKKFEDIVLDYSKRTSNSTVYLQGLIDTDGYVDPFSHGRKLTLKGLEIINAEPDIIKAINSVFIKQPDILPGFAALEVCKEMEENHIDPWEIANKHNIKPIVLSSIITAKACEIYDDLQEEIKK